jgi:hypothetical protein
MELIECFSKLDEGNGRAVVVDDHPLSLEAIGGQETLGFEVSCEPGVPGRLGIDPHRHTRVAAVLTGEKPLPAAVTRVVREADEPAMAGEGVGHA